MNPKETIKKPQRNLQKPYESIYSEVPVGRSARAAGMYIYIYIHHDIPNFQTIPAIL